MGVVKPECRDSQGNLIPWKKRNKEKANATERLRRRLRVAENPEQEKLNRRKWFIKHKFGITPEMREAMIISQDFKCAICFKEILDINSSDWAIDHNHLTDKLRQMLCRPCNSAIGLLKEDVLIFTSAIRYIERHKNGG